MESGRPWAAPAVKPTGVARTLSLVAASHGAQHIYTGLLPLTYPAVLIAFHLSVGSLGLAMGAVGVAGGLSQISAGAVSQRVRARWVLGSQNLVLGLCALLGSWAPVYAAFAGAQGVAQLASSQQHPLGSSIAARAYPERRGMGLSTHNIGGSIGSLLVPLPAAVMISRLGWRPTLLLLSIPLFVMGLIVLLTFPALSKEPRSVRPAGVRRVHLPRLSRTQFIDPKAAGFGAAAATVAAGGRGLTVLSTFVPLFLRDRVGLSEIGVGRSSTCSYWARWPDRCLEADSLTGSDGCRCSGPSTDCPPRW
jgi:MFS family permease